MKAIFILILLIPTLVFGQSISRDGVDEFSGRLVIQTESIRIGHEGFSGEVELSFAYIGGDIMMLIMLTSRDSWQLTRAQSIAMIIDERRETFDLNRLNTKVFRGGVYESHIVFLNPELLLAISEAGDVRFRANRNIFTLNNKAKQSARLLHDRVLTVIN